MTQIDALRTTIALLSAQLAVLEGKPVNTYMGQLLAAAEESERIRLAEIAERQKPHDWKPWTSGMLPSDVGDNEKSDDDFLRAFGPMMSAAGTVQHQFKDSKGNLFFYPNIKARTPGEGWMGVKKEALRMVESDWGQAWMSDEDNIKAGNRVPKTAAVVLLIKQVGANKLPA